MTLSFWMRFAAVFVILFFAFENTDAQPLRQKIIGIESGLPQSTVRAITQDQAGLIYFATDDGISRYDGVRHKKLHDSLVSPRELFSFSDVCALDTQVVGTSFEGGILLFDSLENSAKEWMLDSSEQGIDSQEIIDCAVDSDEKEILVATPLSILKLVRNAQGISLEPILKLEQKSGHFISHIDVIKRQILVATSQGLWTLIDNRLIPVLEQDEMLPTLDFDILESQLWVLTDNQLRLFNWNETAWERTETALITSLNNRLQDELLNRVLVFSDEVWVATSTLGIFVLNRSLSTIEHYHTDSKANALSDNYISALYKSSDATIFAGTWLSGALQFNLAVAGVNSYSSFTTNNGSISSPSIRAMYQEPSGRWWIGTDNDGLLVGDSLSDNMVQFDRFSNSNLPTNSIRVIKPFNEKKLLVGTEDGIGFFNLEEGFIPLKANDLAVRKTISLVSETAIESSANYPGRKVRALLVEEDKSIWMGTYDNGLFYKQANSNRFDKVELADPLRPAKITSIVPENNLIWVATDNLGIFVIDRKNFSLVAHYNADSDPFQRLPNNAIWSIHLSSNGDKWIGSYGQGLARLNSKTSVFEYFREQDGLSNDVVYSILPDNQKNLWMSTNRGITKLNLNDFSFTNYYYSHGLPYDEFNSGAYFKDSSGSLYFGTLKGIVEINPDSVLPPLTYQVLLSDITINGMSIEQHPEVIKIEGPLYQPKSFIVDKNYQRLEFVLSTTEFRQTDMPRFRYRLIGNGLDWNDLPDNNRTIVFNDLDYGSYRLQISVQNTNGYWSDSFTEIDVILNPPWYLSKWALVIYLIITFFGVLLSIELFNRWRQRNAKMLARLQYMVDRRTQELKTKNQQLEMLNIELQQTNEKLKEVSMSDALTGLGNRRMLYQFLERDIGEVNRAYLTMDEGSKDYKALEEHDLLFFLVDVDYFKRINDEHGHLVGDRVLIEISQLLKRLSREGDLVIRFGGEEFLIVMRNTPRHQAEEIANRILKTFRQYEFSVNSSDKIAVRCSVGFAPYPFSAFSPQQVLAEQVIQIADMCLYSAKTSGRNCSVGLVGAYSPGEIKAEEILDNPNRLIREEQIKVLGAHDRSQVQWKSNSHY